MAHLGAVHPADRVRRSGTATATPPTTSSTTSSRTTVPPTYLNVRLHTADEDDVLGQIYQAVDDFLARHPRVPEPARTHVAIAVAEIGANIIEHAGRGRHIRVQMTLQLFTDEIRVDFTDNGRSGDIDLTAVQMPDPMQDRGRGLAVARSVLRRLYYHADDTGNRWTLISNRFNCD